ncbi:act minimal PKS chain-length factor (CLF/KS beta) [Actinoplanes tereljensis]|uniref:Actinorhodin polyketide putative beta-ketoacyl synthase 2 n=1 Tax=Paractinoplanes tereljensis TaxID=571912 RepID=A0A919TQV3_9ACTN|nr:ketosynthase chain-length factor [Actinoplanes tereljensis]GIF17795.1 actinorhodin polyketide putative beta-ketoacyl synthase 2 [Actinoplanes tereljensis]
MIATDTAVFTGMDIIAPTGIGIEDYWSATLAGTAGIRPIERFDASGYPVRLAGEVRGFDESVRVPARLVPQTDRMTQFALAAADGALTDSALDLDTVPEFGRAVVTANSSGGFEFGQRELENLWSRGSEYVGAYQSIAWFYAANTGQVSIRHGFKGNCGVVATEQAGGLDAAGQARRVLRNGAGVVLTGGTDASLCPWGFITQLRTGLLSTRTDPSRAYLPFDADANGFLPGEGGAMLVMEPYGSAAARGARVYGALTGYACGFDPPPGSPRPPVLGRVARRALDDAGIDPAQVDVVFADAAGTPALDRAEAAAIRDLFGRPVPVAAPKAMTGRLYAGGAALDLATALLCLRDQIIPAAAGVTADPRLDIDLVTDASRPAAIHTVLVLARGYGGFNAAAVLSLPGEE